MDIGSIYKRYLKVMALMGHAVRLPKARPQVRAKNSSTSTLSASELDALATRAGNQYRALGTTVGLLGIAIVFLAIAPVGMKLVHETEHILGWIKVSLMAIMLLIVFVGSKGKYKDAWMSLRLKAEDARYLHLREMSHKLALTSDLTMHDALRDGLLAVLVGEDGQIAYDEGKNKQYEDIESFGDVLLWASVALAFCGAVLHQFFQFNWLIFLTAFGPAMVGGIHGVNAFLCVGELAKKHKASAQELSICRDKLLTIHDAASHDTASLLLLADEVLNVLTERDTKWKSMVAEVGIKPA